MKSIIVRNYAQENYKVIFNQKTGFFARVEDKGTSEIFWAKKGPELLDISLTNWCDKNCNFCYKDSNLNGKHMSLLDYDLIMQEASNSNVFQVALGGGNPNQHPNFIEILKVTKEKYNIVPSYTTNGRGLTPSVLEATKLYCGAVAVSVNFVSDEILNAIKLLKKYNIKVNLHYILNNQTIIKAIEWIKNGNELLSNCNAIIFLNYKPVGNGKNYELLLKDSPHLKEFFDLVDNKIHSIKIGFDSCMVSGIVKYMKNYNSISLEPCDAGRFSAYISEDLKMYPCSFMIEHYQGENLKEKSLMDIWNNSSVFNETRNSFNGSSCENCSQKSNCLNGCPFLNKINLCN